jgi:hypothetical protein
MMSVTFAVDILADTAYSPVLDRSVTTIDVEQGVLEDKGAAAEQEETSKAAAETPRGAATGKPTATREASATASPCSFSELICVLLEWVAVGHLVWCCNALVAAVCSSVSSATKELPFQVTVKRAWQVARATAAKPRTPQLCC